MMYGIIACSIFVVFFILTQSKIKRRKKQIKELKAKIKKLECDKKHLEVRLQDAEELAVVSVFVPEPEHAVRPIAATDMSATTLMERRDMCMLFPLRCGTFTKLTPFVSFIHCSLMLTHREDV